MKKKEIEKIECKLSDTEVPDRVLDLARGEICQNIKVRKPKAHRLNLRYAFSCVASLALCLAIILPVALSSFDNKDGGTPPGSSADGSQDSSGTSPSLPDYKFEDLIPDEEVNDGDNSSGGDAIKLLSHINYSDGRVNVISKFTYSVYGESCALYVLHDASFKVDILERFEDFTDEYFVANVKVGFKINEDGYVAEAYYKNKRYCFTGNFAQKSVFEEFCRYLFD